MSKRTRGRQNSSLNSDSYAWTNVDGGSELLKEEFIQSALDSWSGTDKLQVVPSAFNRAVCRFASHDWWALSYPPARRWECHRCGSIVEDVPTSLPDRRRVPRDPVKKANGTDTV